MDSLLDEQVHYKVIQVEKEVYALSLTYLFLLPFFTKP